MNETNGSLIVKGIEIKKDDVCFIKKELLILLIKLNSRDTIKYICYESEAELNEDFEKIKNFLMEDENEGAK